MNLSSNRKAFTLIELLVVVTIIVVLLALLLPAMDKAIYSAELAVCGAKVHAVTLGAITYATGYKRYYPHRTLAQRGQMRPIDIQYYFPSAVPARVDDRPVLRSFISLNEALNCPLAPRKVNLDTAGDTTNVIANYGLWFGFAYRGEKRMGKLGDRFTWAGESYDVLAGDWSGRFDKDISGPPGNEIASHGDENMVPYVFEDQEILSGVKNGPFNFTLSIWTSQLQGGRGPLDLNFGFSDGSVNRFDRVAWDAGWDETNNQTMMQLPQWDIPSNQAGAFVQVPRR